MKKFKIEHLAKLLLRMGRPFNYDPKYLELKDGSGLRASYHVHTGDLVLTEGWDEQITWEEFHSRLLNHR